MSKPVVRVRKQLPESEALQHLGGRLRQARLEAGLSQAQLGAPHFTRAYVSAIELGKVRPAVKSLEFMAARLGKPASYFIDDDRNSEAQRSRELAISEAAILVTRATAAAALPKLSDLIDSSTTPSEGARLRTMRATALNFLGRGDEALADLAAVERIARQLNDSKLLDDGMYQTAIALRNTGQYVRARDLLNDLIKRLEAGPSLDLTMKMKVLKDLGAVAYDMGELDAASGYYASALEWSKDAGDVASLVSIYHGLALAHRGRGDLEAAAGYLQRALGASEVANDLGSTALLHNGLAVLAAERGHVRAAQEHVERAISIARLSGPAVYLPHFLNTKAECSIKLGDWVAALAAAEEALQVAADTGNERAAAAARVALADINTHQRAFADAKRQLMEAAAVYDALGSRPELGECFMRISRIAQQLGETVEAQDYANRAFEATRQTSGLVRR